MLACDPSMLRNRKIKSVNPFNLFHILMSLENLYAKINWNDTYVHQYRDLFPSNCEEIPIKMWKG